jgi:hypothetical protein
MIFINSDEEERSLMLDQEEPPRKPLEGEYVSRLKIMRRKWRARSRKLGASRPSGLWVRVVTSDEGKVGRWRVRGRKRSE